MQSTKITKITKEFDNISRIESQDLILDIYQFENASQIKKGDVFKYKLFTGKLDDIPENSVIMHGKVIGEVDDFTQVSFGGLMGAFKQIEPHFSEGDDISIIFSTF